MNAPSQTGAKGIALWGAGEHAVRNILPAMAAAEAVRLVGIHTRNAEVLNDQTGQWNCAAWTSPDAMLADPAVDIVYVATPIGLHAEHGRRVLAAGKHLFCEKSLSVGLADAEALTAEAAARDLALCVTFGPMFHPQITTLKRLIDDGEVGAVTSITGRFGFPHLAADNIRYSAELGGGVLRDAGFYPVCIGSYLLGGAPEFVSARQTTAPGYAVDTGGAALLRFPGGVTAQLDWGFGRHYRNEIEVWGETGSIFAARAFSKPPTLATELLIRRQDGETVVPVPAADTFATLLDAQAACLDDAALRRDYRARALAQQALVERIIEAAR